MVNPLDYLDDPVFKIDGYTITIATLIITVLLAYIFFLMRK